MKQEAIRVMTMMANNELVISEYSNIRTKEKNETL